jgi:hypothetical protein
VATSGTTTFSVTETEIISTAYEDAGIYGAGRTVGAEDYVLARKKLNMLVKQWASQIDFAPGLKMWTRRVGWLFLQKSQIEYDLGPTGDECAADSYVSTTLASNASGGAGSIVVASATGISSTMRIGVLLDSGSMQWTTVNGAPAGSTVTLTATLTGAASSGNAVYAYSTKVHRPFELVTAVLRDRRGNDTPMDPHLSLAEYEAIPSKSGLGTPASMYFEAKRTNAVVYLDCSPDDLTNVIRLRYLSYVEDSTETTDDIDFPAEWYRPLAAQLAIDLCPAFRKQVTAEMKLVRDESLQIAQNAYPATSVAYYQPDPDFY